MADRRRSQREPTVLVVDYDGPEELVADVNDNVSTGGTFVRTERELPQDTEVELVLSFPGLVRPIRLAGVVRWVRPASRGDGEPGIAIQFHPMAREEQAALEETIAAIERRDRSLVGKLLRVLLAEDNRHTARLIREGLPRTAPDFGDRVVFEFCETADGREALALCRGHRFHAAIVDLNLPVLDGASLIRELRADPEQTRLPIIAVSAGGAAARAAALEAGADLFLGKPMRLRELADSMRLLLQRR